MSLLYTIFGTPLGYVMWACYSLVQNYGIALIVFTLLVKLLLLPLAVKQQKSTVKMAMFQPKVMELQKKYGNNKQKYQEELMALYEKAVSYTHLVSGPKPDTAWWPWRWRRFPNQRWPPPH